MENVYGYVRVSTRSQNYEGQVEQIQNFCKMKGYNLLRTFEDKATGKNTDRPGFQELLGTMEKNPQDVKVIIVTKIDRVGRSLRDLLKFVDWCSEKSLGFVAIGNNIDTTIKEGRLFLYIMGALSEYERELILERTETGRKRYLAEGGKLGKPKMKLPVDEIKRLVGEGVPKTEVARRLRVSVPTIYDRLGGT
jgi:DNA invertase Pin-like site-specific DNA recombinase